MERQKVKMISSGKIPERFIMVDDDAISNMLGQELVRKVCGKVEVQLFMDPMKALAYIETHYSNPAQNIPTMLFLDLHTPSMTGWEFLEKYKQFSDTVHRQFKIFILSSSDEQRDIESAISNAFVSGHIVKPLDKKFLQHLISVA